MMKGRTLPVSRRAISIFLFLVVEHVVALDALSADGSALLEFKRSLINTTTAAPPLRDWNASDATPCNWGGVTCTAEGSVRTINLTAQALEGEISASLGNLESLKELVLSNNALHGNIPPELGKCRSLVVLHLDQNNLSGVIPAALGNLTLLGDVMLSFNQLEGEIPAAFAACPSLYSFDVGTNRLTGRVPPVIFQNLNLEGFYVNNNNLTGDITADLEALSKLPAIIYVWMQFNYFSGTLPPSLGNATSLNMILLNKQSEGNSEFGGTIPKEISNLANLTVLDIRDNNFTGNIPPELGNLISLQYMYLSTNQLTGTIPREFGQLKNMQLLHLYQNQLTGPIPPELGDCELLTEMILYVNNLNGSIPSSFGKLTNLVVFEVYNNTMAGPIPPEIFNCTSLQSLYLSQNQFSGAIPPEIGQLTSLLSLRMSQNKLSGNLPDEVGNLKSLTEMVLNSNSLTGPIPTEVSNLTSLQVIYFFDNMMSGPLPPELGMFTNLTVLDIRNNSFNGTLPSGLCKGGGLWFIDIHNNMFEGDIPTSLATCETLTSFRAGYNRLTSLPSGFGNNTMLNWVELSSNWLEGPLPPGLGVNRNLSNLDLSDNRLSGNLSLLQFAQLPNLQSLNLSKNNFSGEIPTSISSCWKLFVLDLSSNSLSGIIPVALGNLTKLEKLLLQHNNFTGAVPSIYSEFVNLNRLNLARNSFEGTIPTEIGMIPTLANLNLSHAGFSGPIPSELGDLEILEVLDLSYNSLSGVIPSDLGDNPSLLTVNISYNNLTGSLPPTWVKFLAATPSSFVGNPGLCLNYSTDDVCVNMTLQAPATSPKRTESLHVGPLLAIILGSAFFLLIIGIVGWRFLPGRHHVPLVWESSIEFTTAPGNTISFDEIMEATQNLSDRCIIGKGGHGTVYKATLPSGVNIVVKKIVSLDKNTQVHKSFLTEIETIGNAKHRNLVKLLGFCKWGEVGLLLYEYVPNGDLHEALYNKEKGIVLDWPARLCIAEGVAHGIAYLHHDYIPPIIHRDIKSSNVLLDADLEPHISDFGVAKVMDMKPKDKTMASTAVVTGTYGYIAPEYGFGTKVTPKVDVYSYGVLLLELLTGKQPVDSSFDDSMHIVTWVRTTVQQSGPNTGETVLDPKLLRTTNDDQKSHMLRILRTATLCTKEAPAERPTMREVVDMLRTSRSQIRDNC